MMLLFSVRPKDIGKEKESITAQNAGLKARQMRTALFAVIAEILHFVHRSMMVDIQMTVEMFVMYNRLMSTL